MGTDHIYDILNKRSTCVCNGVLMECFVFLLVIFYTQQALGFGFMDDKFENICVSSIDSHGLFFICDAFS